MNKAITTELVESERPSLEIDEVELKVVSGPDRGLRHPLGGDSLRIGSARDAELVLHDRAVSGYHAEIMLSAGGYSIRDLKSKNGLFLGAWRIERAPLQDGMKFSLGSTTIAVRALGRRCSIALAPAGHLGRLCAQSVAMRATAATLARLAATDVTVLIEGETGTGKEVAAEVLHATSQRAAGPFVVFDCGSAQPSLAAAELFGHEKGAFSGADAARPGLFEEADSGTLFIDEIGELPLDVQPLLLGALERQATRRVGGQQTRSHDVRIVAATHRNLAEEVRGRRFREDLYFRLSVARLRIPPLRERPEDIVPLAHTFAREHGVTLSPELLALFAAYDWPGNVRDLRGAVARIAAHLPPLPQDEAVGMSAEPWHEARRGCIERFERDRLTRLLEESGGNLARAAELGGVSRQFLHRMVIKYGLHKAR